MTDTSTTPDDDTTETTVTDLDEIEVDEPEVDTEPPDWLVIAGLCDCNHVAMSIIHPDCFDPHASEPEGEYEAVARGADWAPLVAPLAVTVAERSGLPISAMCTAVYLPRADDMNPTEQEHAAQQQIVNDVYRITNTMPLPSGVHVRGRYDFCGSKHPSRDDTSCRRGTGHDGDHSAYTYRIAVPETWPTVPVLVDLDDGDQDDDVA